jgi:putative ABC transport system substrate-binding protein
MQFARLKRREVIALLGAAAAWPLVARAQQDERVRHIGVLMNRTVDDAHGQARLAALRQALQQLGWSDGRNARIDIRWGEDDVDRERKAALELVALVPDIVVASGTLSVAAVQNISRTLPIVFAAVADPVGAGFVDSLARPGGNATGFMIYEYSLSAKWLELLKQIAPGVTRVAILRNPANPMGIASFSAIQGAAPSFGVEVSGQRSRRRRNRTRDRSLHSLSEWRSDRNTDCGVGSSRSDRRACGTV